MSDAITSKDLFKSDVYIHSYGTDAEIEALKQQMLEAHAENKQPMENNNPGCWRSSVEYSNIDWLLKGVYETAEAALEHYTNVDLALKHGIKNRNIKLEYWSNINEPGSKNVIHSHVQNTFAAVYYIQGEGTGGLKFINPANVLNNCYTVSPYMRDVMFYPKDGELIMWPAWIPHEVEVNTSDRQRINIAFVLQVS